MKKNKLKVEIPIRFKENLEARFNYDNKVKIDSSSWYHIKVHCALCSDFFLGIVIPCSPECPFEKFSKKSNKFRGCGYWIYEIIKGPLEFFILKQSVEWRFEQDELVKKQLELLRKAAEELITWVE